MGACSITGFAIGRTERPLNPSLDGGGLPHILSGNLTLPASYDTGGSTIDLSAYFSRVDSVQLCGGDGMVCQYVRGTNGAPTTGKVKCYNSVSGHTHNIPVTGGQSAAGTGTIQAIAGPLFGKEAATNINIPTSSNTVANASEVLSTTDLHTTTVGIVVVGMPA